MAAVTVPQVVSQVNAERRSILLMERAAPPHAGASLGQLDYFSDDFAGVDLVEDHVDILLIYHVSILLTTQI